MHLTHWLISTQVLYLPNIRPEKLGAASLIAVHRLVAGLPLHDALLYSRDETRSRRWDHKAPFVGSRRRHQNGEEPAFWRASKYVYYTESDQILRIRSSKALTAMALGEHQITKTGIMAEDGLLPLLSLAASSDTDCVVTFSHWVIRIDVQKLRLGEDSFLLTF